MKSKHKDELKLIIQEMINKYKDIQEYDVKKFELHKKDINSVHSSSYTINLNIESFKTINEAIISELNNIRELIDSLVQNLALFNDNKHIKINETEKETIKAFQSLIDEKLALVKIKQKNKNRIEIFLSKVQENGRKFICSAVSNQRRSNFLDRNIVCRTKNYNRRNR
jgi:hypothetical protein